MATEEELKQELEIMEELERLEKEKLRIAAEQADLYTMPEGVEQAPGKALDMARRVADYTGGIARVAKSGTSPISLAARLLSGKQVFKPNEDIPRALAGNAPTTSEYLVRGGAPKDSLLTSLAGFGGDIYTDPGPRLLAGAGYGAMKGARSLLGPSKRLEKKLSRFEQLDLPFPAKHIESRIPTSKPGVLRQRLRQLADKAIDYFELTGGAPISGITETTGKSMYRFPFREYDKTIKSSGVPRVSSIFYNESNLLMDPVTRRGVARNIIRKAQQKGIDADNILTLAQERGAAYNPEEVALLGIERAKKFSTPSQPLSVEDLAAMEREYAKLVLAGKESGGRIPIKELPLSKADVRRKLDESVYTKGNESSVQSLLLRDLNRDYSTVAGRSIEKQAGKPLAQKFYQVNDELAALIDAQKAAEKVRDTPWRMLSPTESVSLGLGGASGVLAGTTEKDTSIEGALRRALIGAALFYGGKKGLDVLRSPAVLTRSGRTLGFMGRNRLVGPTANRTLINYLRPEEGK